MADHRLRTRGSEVVAVTQAVVSELAKLPGMDSLAALAGLPRAQPQVRVDTKWTAAVAKDLHAARGKSLVLAGRRQPAAVHALVDAMNVALGNLGSTVSFRTPVRHDPSHGVAALQGLVTEIAAGAVDTLVITARNPVYGAPADFKLDKLLERVPDVIYYGLYEDETAAVAGTFVPAAHTLESWGDTRAIDGTVSIIQPLIAPLWSPTTEASCWPSSWARATRAPTSC
jgi:molybdopterin-containing oxidoreductase family iron-sulfur binding subunit